MVLALKGNLGRPVLVIVIVFKNLRHRVKFVCLKPIIAENFLTSFGGELGLNGFSTSGGFLVSFSGGRAENGKNNY